MAPGMLRLDNEDKVLVVAPHADDEVHCAGTVAKAVAHGAQVASVSFSFCADSLPPEFSLKDIMEENAESLDSLGVPPENRWHRDFDVRNFSDYRQDILEHLVMIRREFQPTVVLCPASTDTHQDHRVVYEECERLFRTELVLGWMHPLNMRSIPCDVFVPITWADWYKKLGAWGKYASQHGKGVFGTQWLETICATWGRMSRGDAKWAEAFQFIGGNFA